MGLKIEETFLNILLGGGGGLINQEDNRRCIITSEWINFKYKLTIARVEINIMHKKFVECHLVKGIETNYLQAGLAEKLIFTEKIS